MAIALILNGCSSSGKSSIARALQYQSDELWLTFGVDTLISMMPQGKQMDDFFEFIPGKNDRGSVMHVDVGGRGAYLFETLPFLAGLLLDRGYHVIVDDVMLDEKRMSCYGKVLQAHQIYRVGIFCELSVMQQREYLRGNRLEGLANDQVDRVHQVIALYDLQIDTTHRSPFECAKDILSFIKNHPESKAKA